MKKVMVASFMMLATLSLSVSAAQFIENKPLNKAISAKIGDVGSGTLTLPVITWGGDVATLLANGGVNTTPESPFGTQGLDFKIVRQDVFSDQIVDYISGKTPYLRGTAGMINQALSALGDSRVRPVVVYQQTWSTGGDVLVVRPTINEAKDLKGKTIVVQAYGPHIDFMVQTLKDAGVSPDDVNIKYVKDISGTDNSPAEAFREDSSIDAAFVISPDAAALTGGAGNTGTGAEGTVKGAKYLMSTKTANRVIADVYAVRSDYLKENPTKVEAFVNALMIGQEKLAEAKKDSKFLASAAKVFLDSPEAVEDINGLLADCEFVGYQGNVKFFTDSNYPRRFSRISAENQEALIALGLLSSKITISDAGFDYEKIKDGLRNTVVQVESPRFDPKAVAALVAQKGDKLESVFTFTVEFEPGVQYFNPEDYKQEFEKVISLASTYAGAVLTVEGHCDPNMYLESLRSDNTVEAKQRKQSGINLSLKRANSVREALLDYSKTQNVYLDESQVTTVGHGPMKPVQGIEETGKWKGEPKVTKSEEQWRKNMRVEFRIANVEAESDVFVPLK